MDSNRLYYKYCPWDENTKTNIEKHQIYPTKSNQENDPFENLPSFNSDEWAKQIENRKRISINIILHYQGGASGRWRIPSSRQQKRRPPYACRMSAYRRARSA